MFWVQARWVCANQHFPNGLNQHILTCALDIGLGIAYVAALRAKVPVLLHDRSDEQIGKGLKLMDKLLAKDVSKGKIQDIEAKEARDRITVIDGSKGISGLRDVDMVIEVRGPHCSCGFEQGLELKAS